MSNMLPKNLTSTLKTDQAWDSLGVQWLRLHVPNAGNLVLIPTQGIRPHSLQFRVCMLYLKVPQATAKTQCSEINKNITIKSNFKK